MMSATLGGALFSMLSRCFLWGTLLAATAPAEDTNEPAASMSLGVLRVRAGPIEEALLRDELALRLPDVALWGHEEDPPAASAGSLTADLELRPISPPGRLEMTLVVSDGRAFDRTVELEADQSAMEHARMIARAVSNLVFAVEAGEVVADRDDVPLPTDAPLPCPEPVVTVLERHRDPPPVVVVVPPTVPSEEVRRWDIAVGVALGARVGLGPPHDVDRFTDANGGGRLRVRAPRGWVIGGDFIFGGRGHVAGPRLMRYRVQLGAGYVWRPLGAVEVEAMGAFVIEPWQLISTARPLGRLPPAVGGVVRLAVGYRWAPPERQVALRLGLWGDYSLTAVPESGAMVAKVSVSDGRSSIPLFRIGGSEVSGGLELLLWWTLGGRS